MMAFLRSDSVISLEPYDLKGLNFQSKLYSQHKPPTNLNKLTMGVLQRWTSILCSLQQLILVNELSTSKKTLLRYATILVYKTLPHLCTCELSLRRFKTPQYLVFYLRFGYQFRSKKGQKSAGEQGKWSSGNLHGIIQK